MYFKLIQKFIEKNFNNKYNCFQNNLSISKLKLIKSNGKKFKHITIL